jgi:hypothetical protein
MRTHQVRVDGSARRAGSGSRGRSLGFRAREGRGRYKRRSLSPFFLTSNHSQLNSWGLKRCVTLRFSPTGSLGCWLEVHCRRGRGVFILQIFQHLLVLKMSDAGASSRDRKGKSKHGSRGEKRRRELEARGEPIQRFAGASGSTTDPNKPSEECKATVFQAFYKWFRNTSFTYINRNFLALGDVVGKDAF